MRLHTILLPVFKGFNIDEILLNIDERGLNIDERGLNIDEN